MKTKTAPERLLRAMEPEIDVDLAARILRRARFVTRRLASDGGIVDPQGINVRFFQANPVVLARHGLSDEVRSPVIGRSLGLSATRDGMESMTQFADTDLGREYAYLYGVNEKREVYMRGWSFGWTTVEMDWLPLAQARSWLGADWDDDLVPPAVRSTGEVWLARKTILNEYSAVPVGADRAALSRAWTEGVRLAGGLIADLELRDATTLLKTLQEQTETDRARLAKIEAEIQALRRDGAAAAARGDSAELVAEIRALTLEMDQRRN